jgi:hypothetical protein
VKLHATFSAFSLTTLLMGCDASGFCVRSAPNSNFGMPAGSQFQLEVGRIDILGECDRPYGGEVTWESTNTAVARVTPDAVLRALAPGITEIIAQSEGSERRIRLEVVPRVARIAIFPSDTSITVGDTAIFQAVAFGVDGNPLPNVRVSVSPAGDLMPTPWLFPVSHVNPRLAPLRNAVAVQALQEGSTHIVGSVIGFKDSVPVHLRKP